MVQHVEKTYISLEIADSPKVFHSCFKPLLAISECCATKRTRRAALFRIALLREHREPELSSRNLQNRERKLVRHSTC